MAGFDDLFDLGAFDGGFSGGSFGGYGGSTGTSGGGTGGGGGADPASVTASTTNGENTGADTNRANAWWRLIHPGMGGGEGVAGGDSVEYPGAPSWFTGQSGFGLSGNQWQLDGMSTANAQNKSGVNPFGSGGVDSNPYVAQGASAVAPWMNVPAETQKAIGWQGNGDLTNGILQTVGSGENYGGLETNPNFLQALGNKGLTYGHQDELTGSSYLNNLFDNTGKPIGTPWKTNPGSDDAFETAVDLGGAALGGVAGAQAAGAAYGGVAGAASDAGSLGAGATGATASSVGSAVPAWAAGAASGAGSGFMGTAARTGDIFSSLKAAGIGGLTGGLAGGIDAAGALGIDDAAYAKPINSAVSSGLKAGITGQPIGSAVLNSGLTSGLSAGLNAGYNGVKNMDYGNGDGGSDPWNTDNSSGGGGNTNPVGNYSRPADPNWNQDPYSFKTPANPNASYVSPDNMPSSLNLNSNSAAWPTGSPQQTSQNPIKQSVMGGGSSSPYIDPYNSMAVTGVGNSGNAPQGGFDNMAGNLMQLYQSYKNQKQYGGLASNLNSLYGQNSPYAQQLSQTLMRQDAAAGRRSQVGPRSVELQARLADLNSRNAPELAKLYGSQQNNQAQMLMSMLRMGGNVPGGLGGLWDKGQNWWNNQQNPTPPTNTSWNNDDWAPGD